MNHGVASGTVLCTDSTHLKANANKNKYDMVEVKLKPAAEPETREIKVSRTDPEAGCMGGRQAERLLLS